MSVAPFDLARCVPPAQKTRDLVHRFSRQQHQISGGKMDKSWPGTTPAAW
jgi:phospholipase C